MSIKLSYHALAKCSDRQPVGHVVALGQFDGCHLGHQALFHAAKKIARRLQCLSSVLLLDPLPKILFGHMQPQERLMTTQEQMARLASLGLDCSFCLSFDQHIAQLSPEAFVSQLLIAKCNALAVVVGEDFRFGHKRQGDAKLLQQLMAEADRECSVVPELSFRGKKIGSTWCRELIGRADFKTLEHLLGQPWSCMIQVMQNHKLGGAVGELSCMLLPNLINHWVTIKQDQHVQRERITITLKLGVCQVIIHHGRYQGNVHIIFD